MGFECFKCNKVFHREKPCFRNEITSANAISLIVLCGKCFREREGKEKSLLRMFIDALD